MIRKTVFGRKKFKAKKMLELDVSNSSCYVSGNTYMTCLATGKNVDLINGPTYSSPALVFDGTNDYAFGTTFEDVRLSNETTLELYFQMNAVGGYKELFCHETSAKTHGFRLQLNGSNLQISNNSDINLGITVSTGIKYYVTLTISGTNCRVFLNGVYQRTVTIGTQDLLVCSTYVIATNNLSRFASMRFYYARVHTNKLLTDAEILANYTSVISRF